MYLRHSSIPITVNEIKRKIETCIFPATPCFVIISLSCKRVNASALLKNTFIVSESPVLEPFPKKVYLHAIPLTDIQRLLYYRTSQIHGFKFHGQTYFSLHYTSAGK